MTLEYRNEETESKESTEDSEDVRLVKPVIAYYTYILLICISVVTLIEFAAGTERSVLIAGFVKPAFIEDREYWRILTGAVLHADFSHILFNGYALYSFGRAMESLTNHAHLANVFLLAVIGGGLLSLAFMPDGISVGASGGIVGLIGYLAVYGFRRRQLLSPEFLKNILINIGIMTIFGIALYKVIDNFDHLGGLLTGAVYGFFQISKDLYENPLEASKATQYSGLMSLGIFIAVSIFSILLILRVF